MNRVVSFHRGVRQLIIGLIILIQIYRAHMSASILDRLVFVKERIYNEGVRAVNSEETLES